MTWSQIYMSTKLQRLAIESFEFDLACTAVIFLSLSLLVATFGCLPKIFANSLDPD